MTPAFRPLSFAILLGFAIGLLPAGCVENRPNPEHCSNQQGDASCAERFPGGDRPACAMLTCSSEPWGCVAEPPAADCHSPCGEGASASENSICLGTADDTDTTTETESGPECTVDEDCAAPTPFCVGQVCGSCDQTEDPDAACADASAGATPVCLGLEGVCVECTADNTSSCEAQLVCDLETHACVPCTAHDQCEGGAGCDLVLGECLPADAVWHVDGDGGQDFLTIGEALAALGNGSGTLIIHALATEEGYVEGISVAGDRALAVFGADGERPILFQTPVSLEVANGARVYTRGLTLRGEDAALISASHVEFDSVSFAPQIRSALRVEDSVLRMRNSMVRTTLDPIYPAIELVGACDIDIRYATVLGFGDQPAVACQGALLVPGSRIRNSMLVNLGVPPAVQCASPAYEHNGLEDATGFLDNTTIGDATAQWFVDPLYGDLHLSIVAPVSSATAASWSVGDPLVDYDGDPRPTIEASPDFVGADRLP